MEHTKKKMTKKTIFAQITRFHFYIIKKKKKTRAAMLLKEMLALLIQKYNSEKQ